jgi:hypothetical protein
MYRGQSSIECRRRTFLGCIGRHLYFWAGMDDMNTTTTTTSSQPKTATTSWTHTYDRMDLNERWCVIVVDCIVNCIVLRMLQHNVTKAIAVKRA